MFPDVLAMEDFILYSFILVSSSERVMKIHTLSFANVLSYHVNLIFFAAKTTIRSSSQP